jgi:hypothetical protein
MTKELLKGFTMLALILVMALATAVVTAQAQASNKVIADVPFEFSVGYKTIAAGECIVRTVASAGDALLIQSGDEGTSALRLTAATDRAKDKSRARLVFHRYGQRYFLAEVWSGANASGRRLLESREEHAIARELANIASINGPARDTYEIVEVVAVLR